MAFAVLFEENAEKQFYNLDKSIQERIVKKLKQLERDGLPSRHLQHGVPVFVEEVGQYRIVFKLRQDLKQKRVVFIGDHKQYEKWYSRP
ncbi:MAG: hypothetical protein AB1626_04330 [Candidatus Micrarchaeota archaeon]